MLSGHRIHELLQNGSLRFDGLVRGDGLLLTLGSELLQFAARPNVVDPLDPESVLGGYEPQINGWCTYDLDVKGAVLIAASEHMSLPPDIGGMLGTLSHVARLGLFAHYCSPTVGPRFTGRLALEIFNAAPHPVRLHRGMAVAKVILFQTAGTDPVSGPEAIPFFYNSAPHETSMLASRYAEEFSSLRRKP